MNSSPPRHLLLIVPFYEMGGANKFDLDLIEQLHARGWDVTCLATQHSAHAWLDAYRQRARQAHRLDNLEGIQAKLDFINRLAQSEPPDAVLIAQAELGYLLLPYLGSLFPKAAIMNYVHLEETWGNGGFAGYSAGLQPLLDATLVSSESLASAIHRRAGGVSPKVHVCPVNVNTDWWRPDVALREQARAKRGLVPQEIVIAFSGRIVAQKQPRVLAQSLKTLAAKGVTFRGLIAGDGPEREWLAREFERANFSSRVRFEGALDPAGVREVLAAADIFFLPSANEGIALSIYEAMAMGLPIVGADVGGQRELVTPACGTLLPPIQAIPEFYALELGRLIGDRTTRLGMGVAARARVVEHFALPSMGAKFVSILDLAMESKRERLEPGSRGEAPAALAEAAILFAGETSSHTARQWLDFALRVAEIEQPRADYGRFVLRHARRMLERTPTFRLRQMMKFETHVQDDESVLRAFRASLLAKVTRG